MSLENNISFKIQLYPTEKQIEVLNEYFGASRFVYNYVIDSENEIYEKESKFLSKYSMNSKFTKDKKSIPWLNKLDSTALKLRVFDAVQSFINFFNNKKYFNKPIYKTKKSVSQMTCIRGDRVRIEENNIYCPGIGWIACGYIPNENVIGQGLLSKKYIDWYRKYYNARIIFDGYKYWFTFTMEISDNINYNSLYKYPISDKKSKTIGIDIGCKGTNWIVDSNGVRVSLPDMSKENKKIKHFQRKLDRQTRTRTKCDDTRSKNMMKTIAEINKYHKRKINKRRSTLYDYICHNILSLNPESVVIEDISSYEMIRDNDKVPRKRRAKLNQSIIDSSIGEFQIIINYKCRIHSIPLIVADRNYPSTKRCSVCSNVHNIGMKRIYKCPICGSVLDRDLNAAYNLAIYPSL